MGRAHSNPPPIPWELTEAGMKADAADQQRLKALPPEQFNKEMRIREVKALERTANRPRSTCTHYDAHFGYGWF